MFIKSLSIENYRTFSDVFTLDESHIGIPDGTTNGSGLTILVGENGVGKTSILEAIAMTLMSYKAETLGLNDFAVIENPIEVKLNADSNFVVKKTMSGEFEASGFHFTAKLRTQNSTQYLVGTAVSDTAFVPVSATSPRAGSPDLRVAVENPFAGARFKENDYIYLDKNRTKVLETGTFSQTKFNRVLDNLNFQYLKLAGTPLAMNDAVNGMVDPSVQNVQLAEAFNEFEALTSYKVSLNILDDKEPYGNAYLGFKSPHGHQIPLSKLGSGYQMFLALMCQQKLSQQSGKKLIIMIDEVELHLHPKIQKSLVKILLELSATEQIILTTHSPELLKDLQISKAHKVNAIVKDGDQIVVNPVDEYVLPTPTISETNYVAFGLASMEYFIELYNQIGSKNGMSSVAAIDHIFSSSGEPLINWERDDHSIQPLTKYSCIRNKFHHPGNTLNDSKFAMGYADVDAAIVHMRTLLV